MLIRIKFFWNNVLKKIPLIFRYAIMYYILACSVLIFFTKKDEAGAVRMNTISAWGAQPFVHVQNPERMTRQHWRQAMTYYQILSEFFPKPGRAYGMLGYCSYFLDDLDSSIHFYEKAVQENPAQFWFYYNLGVIYMSKQDYEKAASYFEMVLNMPRQKAYQASILTNLGKIDPEARKKLFNEAVDFANYIYDESAKSQIMIKIFQEKLSANPEKFQRNVVFHVWNMGIPVGKEFLYIDH